MLKRTHLGPGRIPFPATGAWGAGVRDEGKKVSREHAEQAQGKRKLNVLLLSIFKNYYFLKFLMPCHMAYEI